MPIIVCPKCSKKLQVKELPESGKVKCPACSTILALAKPKSGQPSQSSSTTERAKSGSTQSAPGSSAPVSPAKRSVVSSPPPILDASSGFGNLDFGGLPPVSSNGSSGAFLGAGSSSFPAASVVAPMRGLTSPVSSASAPSMKSPVGATPALKDLEAKANNPVILAVAGVASFLVVGIISFFVVNSFFSAAPRNANSEVPSESPVPPAASTPAGDSADGSDSETLPAEGFEVVKFQGAAVQMPLGDDASDRLTTAMEFKAVLSTKTQSYYFFGVMDAGVNAIDNEQLRKKIARQFKADYLGGTPTQRNGYQGIKGMIDGSLFVPRMQCETLIHEERVCVIGCAPYSMGADVEVQMTVDRGAEQAEMDAFLSSLKIGPKPSGSWFF